MDAKELRAIIDGVARDLPNALLENKGFEQTMYSIGKIAAYLQSEQDKRILLTSRMNQHQELMEKHQKSMGEFDKLIWGDKSDVEKYPGIAHDWADSRRQSKRNEKLIIGVLIVLIPVFIIAVAQMLGFKIR